MNNCSISLGRFLSSLVLILALFTISCDRQAGTPPISLVPGEVLNFTGTWSATGFRQTMKLESGHETMIFRLTGSLLLAGEQRLRRGFKADVIGFSDNRSGMEGRCVWTDDRGDKVFSELHGEGKVPGELIEGIFLGGTGRYASVSGKYTFRWKRLIDKENGDVSGRVVDMKGWVRDGSPEALPATTEARK